ncbi:MAG: DUF4173 domain-containing protein [Gemmatimonadales bacterium]
MRSPTATVAWTTAILTAALGAAILFDAEPGINWPIWVAAASISLIVSRFATGRRVETPLLVLLAWAVVLSIGFALTANDFLHFLIVLSDAMLLGLAVITLGAENWSELSAKLLVAVPFLAPYRVVGATAYEAAGAPRSASSPRSRAIIKGALLSLPLVIVLIALLGNADPVIRWSTDRLAEWLPNWSFLPRIMFFAFLLALTLGANSLGVRQLVANFPRYPAFGASPTVGLTEQQMMLWSASVVLWLFVALQASYLIHPPPAAIGTGVTFADFARRGFGELSFAVTLVGAIILVLEYARPTAATERDRLVLRRLELALVIALELVLVSAFSRIILYEQAYGFTQARIVAQAYMIVMALSVAALAAEIMRGMISIAFGRRVAEFALGALTVLVFWNHEAWIVNRNIDRAVTTGKFDASYATDLSKDAVPTLLRRRNEIPSVGRDTVELRLACQRVPATRRWFEWNRAVSAYAKAMESWGPPGCLGPAVKPRAPAPTNP